jgi:hypothetical protein
VGVEYSPVVEVEQLMFSSSLDALDDSTGSRPRTRCRQASTEGWMQQGNARDGFSACAPAEHLHRRFDFR